MLFDEEVLRQLVSGIRREPLMKAARCRRMDMVLVPRIDRWGARRRTYSRPSRNWTILDVGFASLTEPPDLGAPNFGYRNAMKKPRREPIREDRIDNEAIVDARPEEQAMGWYYYLEDKIRFPFPAKCIATKVISPLRKGETAEVIRMAPEDNCAHDMFVLVRWQGRKMAVPLSQLVAIAPDESTLQAIGDWHYWIARGYTLGTDV